MSMGDPTVDLLEFRAMPRLASALRERQERIIRLWEENIRALLPRYADDLSQSQLRDHLPIVLEQMASALAAVTPGQAGQLSKKSESHGTERFRQNYDINGLLVEYRLLRRILFEEIHLSFEGRMSSEEIIALNQAADMVEQEGVLAFVERQNERLRASAEAEAKYLSFLSHDLRNHLNSAVLRLELLSRRLASRPEFAEHAESVSTIQRSIRETVSGMDRLLQAERLRKGAVEPQRNTIQLGELASEVGRQFASQAGRKGLELRIDVPGGAVIHSDHELIGLVLQNLIGNAVKYSQRGVVSVTAQPLKDEHGEAWVVSVADQGPGIAPEQQKRLFEAFARGETHGQEGVGLGLSIASQAARLLGGKLSLRSEPGAGSTFSIVLPTDIRAKGAGPRAPYA